MRKIEKEAQAKWATSHAFELDAPGEGEEAVPEKFMATFPYPYMNGLLHLGHGFTASKAEFAVAFERMRGKRALWPFGFHCTGMPIKASADKLKKEMATYGCPPVIPSAEAEPQQQSGASKQHSKVAAKTGNVKLQWEIMRQLGISDEEIPKFADPAYWMEYFPPLTQRDLAGLGFHIDWRRSFITTDRNPFYDSFIRWQFNKLRAQDKIKFGKRHTIYSPLDGQPCLDHDRQSGEGVEPKEYTVIKLRILGFPEGDARFDAVRGATTVHLGAATLRPETMYGQTNCWVGPDIEYGAFRTSTEGELMICTPRAARNMAHQGLSAREGQVECVATFKGADLIGLPLSAPRSVNTVVYVLPMFAVSAAMGTGVVTSVPSNSPADYVALRELKEKEPLRRKFGIEDSMVLPFEPVPIIDSAAYGELSAETVVKQLGIKSQNDAVALEKAKEMVYKDDFYSGVMKVGPHAGKSIQDAKTAIREELVEEGAAFTYYEPERQVMSRSGDECVVALTDQWYLDYGEPSWRAQAELCLSRMTVYSEEVRHQFASTLNWMRQWACSRSFGLGSRMPWDPAYLIESLSDSTIYMAYYSVAHILHQGSFDGSVRPHGIAPEQMSDAVWEWIFGEESGVDAAQLAKASGITAELLERMRREFRYWYPMDLRVSGKDLVPNHLTFSIYNHVALFPEKYWPRGMRANGHLLLNSQKMSKSTGNFMTLCEALGEFGADATRLAFADAGDTVEDANFLRETANMGILRLYTQVEFCQEMMREMEAGSLRQDAGDKLFHDRVFAAEMDRAIKMAYDAYEATNYRDALKYGFFELQNARDHYRDATATSGTVGMNANLIKRFMEVQTLLLAPITPHFCEHVWGDVMKKPGSIVQARFPEIVPIQEDLLAAAHYVRQVAHNLRTVLQAERRPKKGAAREGLNAAEVFVAKCYPKWQVDAVAILRSCHDGSSFVPDDQIVAALKPLIKERANKKLIPFVMDMKNRVKAEGLSALDRSLGFDEQQVLHENVDYLAKSMGLLSLEVCPIDPTSVAAAGAEAGATDDEREALRRKETAIPGEPTVFFFEK